jgi:anion-transporting  ArsA/GET3 family ATPase
MATRTTSTRHKSGSNAPASEIIALLAAKEMVLVCGSGGVGKTTMAAALAVSAAVEIGGRVLVLTVDPAKRLADALGVGALGNTARRVPNEAFAEHGVEPRGELWAAMLDTKAGWDELIHRHAPDAKLRESVLANPLYQNITSRFVHSHDYLAMEQLHELHASGRFDLIIVDTPPSRNALDVIDAPGRMKEFFGSRLLKWLTVPYRSRLFTFASKPFYQLADRVLGSRFLQDVAEFFMLFQAMEPGFVRHANEVEQLLGDPRTTFIVVSTLEAAPSHEAAYLARELVRRNFHLGAIVANRVLPPQFTATASATSARKLAKLADGPLADQVVAAINVGTAEEDIDRDVAAAVIAEIGNRFHDVAVVATREAERRAELAALAPMLVAAPILDRDVNDIADLYDLATALRV